MPRNKWSGKIYENEKIQTYLRENWDKAYFLMTIEFQEEDVQITTKAKVLPDGSKIRAWVKDIRTLVFTQGKREIPVTLESDIEEILGWKLKENILLVRGKGETKYITIKISPLLAFKMKVARIINDWILGPFHFWPSWTELDFIPTGWRKRFGEDLCKDLRRAIVKSYGWKSLWKYWVFEMKEKYKELRIDLIQGHNPEIEEVLEKYRKLSHRVCMVCGEDAVGETSLCKKHGGDL